MSTISVPIPPHLEEAINNLIKNGNGSNKAEIIRRAITRFVEEEAVNVILKAQQEPTLRGDLRDLSEKFK
jgi:Arc/MetJ-type ribon-helix-helix transcriptional regulator